MALLKHKGGSLQVWDAEGNKSHVLHYGPGLHIPCPTCKVSANMLCITANGSPLKKIHVARGGV